MSAAFDPTRARVLLATFLLLLGLLAVAPGAAGADEHEEPEWAPFAEATITPGVQTVTDGSGQCTANFIFYTVSDDGQADVFIGHSAHCAGTGGATATDGCEAGSQELGTAVDIEGADQPGELAYSSWLTMQAVGETDANTCAYNDFALVRIHPDDHGKVNPSVPFWGGPTGVNTDGAPSGSDVYSYGNSSLRLGVEHLSPKRGVSLGTGSDGWNHPVYTLTPGIPGDSGSAFLDDAGQALGTLSTLQIAPLAGANGVTDIHLALEYARAHDNPRYRLAHGTEGFTPRLPLPLP